MKEGRDVPTELFTLSTLRTLSGASLATTLVVEYIKDWPLVRRLPTRVLALLVGEGVMFLTTFPSTSIDAWSVALLNGPLIGSTAIGNWHLLKGSGGTGSA